MKKHLWFALVMALAVLVLRGAAEAQEDTRALAEGWTTVPADSGRLAVLLAATLAAGGDVLFGAVREVTEDADRPALVRIHALAALHGYVHRAGGDAGLRYLLTAAQTAEARECAPVRVPWKPGDTIDICVGNDPRGWMDAWRTQPVGHESPAAAAAVIHATLRRVADGPDTPGISAAALGLLIHLGGAELPPEPPPLGSSLCRPGAPPPHHRGPVGDTVRVYPPAEVTQLPAMTNICDTRRFLERNYPPLARDEGRMGSAVVSLVVGYDGRPRDVRVVRSSGGSQFADAARRAAERFRFTPAQVDGQRVKVRVEVPIEFRFRYPFIESVVYRHRVVTSGVNY